ncbi:MAG: FG-GAP-like repeat-containing protein [Chthoniobacterales bacterium]
MGRLCLLLATLAAAQISCPSAAVGAQPRKGVDILAAKITEGQRGFTGDLDVQDYFGKSVAGIGDLDGDGVIDAAVGTQYDDDGGLDRGAVYILFLNPNATVKSEQKISSTVGGFTGDLQNADEFGSSVSAIGDLNGDGVVDLAVGAPGSEISQGAVWIVFLNSDGTVLGQQKISATEGGFTGELNDDLFGQGVTGIGDLDGDGVPDLAVGAPLDDDGGIGEPFPNLGAVYVLFLNPDGTVKSNQKISQTEGGFTGDLNPFNNFGYSVANAGDVNADGVTDLVVGAWTDDTGAPNSGAAWIVFLNPDGTVNGQQKITSRIGGFTGRLGPDDFFGVGVSSVGDLNGDGVPDVAVGSYNKVWLLSLNGDGTVASYRLISANTTRGRLQLGDDFFGNSVGLLGDLNGDGRSDLLVGAIYDSDSAYISGATWIIALGGGTNP